MSIRSQSVPQSVLNSAYQHLAYGRSVCNINSKSRLTAGIHRIRVFIVPLSALGPILGNGTSQYRAYLTPRLRTFKKTKRHLTTPHHIPTMSFSFFSPQSQSQLLTDLSYISSISEHHLLNRTPTCSNELPSARLPAPSKHSQTTASICLKRS